MLLTPRSSKELFRLFLLEDDDGLCQSLVRILPAKIRGTTVLAAGTIEDGLRLLENDPQIDLGLLDIRVPLRPRMADEANPQVADRLNALHVAYLCFTGHRESPDVLKFMERLKLTSPPVALIEKTGRPEFLTNLLAAIREWFVQKASQQVGSKFRSLFEPGAEASRMRSGTAALMTLQQSVIDYWEYLDSPTRDSIRKWFLVEEQNGEIQRLSLQHRTEAGS